MIKLQVKIIFKLTFIEFDEIENNTNQGSLDLFKINRKLRYQTDYRRTRKLKINNENNTRIDCENFLNKDIKIEKAYKNLFFNGISDNFYLNILDMYDVNKVGICTRNRIKIFDGNREPNDENFIRHTSESLSSEIYSIKFL